MVRFVFRKGGVCSEWSFVRVVPLGQSGLSQGWCLVRVVVRKGGVWSEWSFFLAALVRVVLLQCALWLEWSLFNVGFLHDGLSSGWSFKVVFFHT